MTIVFLNVFKQHDRKIGVMSVSVVNSDMLLEYMHFGYLCFIMLQYY